MRIVRRVKYVEPHWDQFYPSNPEWISSFYIEELGFFPELSGPKSFILIAAHAGRMSPVRPVQVPNCEDRSDPEQDPDVQRDA